MGFELYQLIPSILYIVRYSITLFKYLNDGGLLRKTNMIDIINILILS